MSNCNLWQFSTELICLENKTWMYSWKEANKKVQWKKEHSIVKIELHRFLVQGVCDHNHWSIWSIVGWHAKMTFTHIICHHFTIKPRFMALVNRRPLKVLLFPLLSSRLLPFIQVVVGVWSHHGESCLHLLLFSCLGV